MMKKSFKVTIFLLSIVLATMCFGCAPKVDKNDKTIRIYLWSATSTKTPDGFQEVVDYFNNNVSPKLDGIKVQFSFDLLNDYKSKISLGFSAGKTDYDMIFDAQWINLENFAQAGHYYNLEEDFNDTAKYPGLTKAFSKTYLNNNKFYNGLYAIPMTDTYAGMGTMLIRKDWRELCAADTAWSCSQLSENPTTASDLADRVDNSDEFEYFVYWVKDNAGKHGIPQNVDPFPINSNGGYGPLAILENSELPTKTQSEITAAGIKEGIELLPAGGFPAKAYINSRKEVVAVQTELDGEGFTDGASLFPSGFNDEDTRWQANYAKVRRWKNDKIMKDTESPNLDALKTFQSGLGACAGADIAQFSAIETVLKNNVPDAKLEIFMHDINVRNQAKHCVSTDFKAWNFLCIPKYVPKEKKDMCLKFLDWVYDSQENNDLFSYGIKGKHWNEAKDANGDVIKNSLVTTKEPYLFNRYLLSMNAKYARTVVASDPMVMVYSKYQLQEDRYVARPYSAFTFKTNRTSELETALKNTAISSYGIQKIPYYIGNVDNPITAFESMKNGYKTDANVQQALKVIRQELMQQLQEYIDSL